MISLRKAKRHLLERWRQADRRLLLLDLDGTLAPIMRRPSDVRLSVPVRGLLRCLSRDRKTRVGIISGRSLRDLKRLAPIEGLWLAGNHGLEMRGQGLKRPGEALPTRQWIKRLHLFGEKARRSLMTVPGAFVEDKHLTLSIHYRNVSHDLYPQFFNLLWYLKSSATGRAGRWRRGKMVWEFRPALNWDKGKAAAWMAGIRRPGVILVIGDDLTDEDMFVSLSKRAFTVHVGVSKTSSARYTLPSPRAVERLLQDLSEVR